MRVFLLYVTWVLVLLPGASWAYRDYFTTEQKAQLAKIQTVLVDAIALTDKGAVDAGPIAQTVSRRLGELGYTIVQDRVKPHDAVVKVKCERRCRLARCSVAALEGTCLSAHLSLGRDEGQMATGAAH
jgi:hypothetical protein